MEIALHSEVKKEPKPVVVSPQRLLALALLVFALEKLKLGEPLIHSVRDFRSISIVLISNNGYVCVQSIEVCLLAFTGGDRLIEIVADVFPRTSAVSERVRARN